MGKHHIFYILKNIFSGALVGNFKLCIPQFSNLDAD